MSVQDLLEALRRNNSERIINEWHTFSKMPKALRYAVRFNNLNVVRYMLESGVRESKSDDLLLECVCALNGGHDHASNLEILRLLLQHGIQLKEPFMFINRLPQRYVALLIDYGAVVRSTDERHVQMVYVQRLHVLDASTCLLHARKSRWINHNVMDLLVQHLFTFRVQ